MAAFLIILVLLGLFIVPSVSEDVICSYGLDVCARFCETVEKTTDADCTTGTCRCLRAPTGSCGTLAACSGLCRSSDYKTEGFCSDDKKCYCQAPTVLEDLCELKTTAGASTDAFCQLACLLQSPTSIGRCNTDFTNCTCVEDKLCPNYKLPGCAMYCQKKNGNKAEASCDSGSCTCSGVGMPLADPCQDSDELCNDICLTFETSKGGHCGLNRCQCVKSSDYCTGGTQRCRDFCSQYYQSDGNCDALDQCVCGTSTDSGSVAIATAGFAPVFTIALYLFVQLFSCSHN